MSCALPGDVSCHITEQHRGDLADLDGLLVNSDNFNQVFIQKTNKQWLKKVMERIATSPKHLNKLVEILVHTIISDKHPEWIKRALRWLSEILQNPLLSDYLEASRGTLLQFLSYSVERAALNNIIQLAAEKAKEIERVRTIEKSRSTVILDTGYIFVDDSDDNFGVRNKRQRTSRQQSSVNFADSSNAEVAAFDGSEVSLLDDESHEDESNSDDVESQIPSSDDGVFDVEDEASISDSHLARTGSIQGNQNDQQLNGSENGSSSDNDSVPDSHETDYDSDAGNINFVGNVDEDDEAVEDIEMAPDEQARLDRLMSLRSPPTLLNSPSTATTSSKRRRQK